MYIIPDASGTYVLILRALSSGTVMAGSSGGVNLVTGYLAYAGSALGRGGLRARVRRHIISDKKQFWHVDYIRPYTLIDEIWFFPGREKLEHLAASALQSLPSAFVAAENFGSSDCRCESHLFRFNGKPAFNAFRDALGNKAGACKWNCAKPAGRPVIVVSKCLAGYNCRYNGETLESDIVDRLRLFADLIEVCPEMEIGLPVPRRPVNIVISEGKKKLIQSETGEDLTGSMIEFSSYFINRTAPVSGFIMKGRSPSCGIGNTPVHGSEGTYRSGLFASAFRERCPETPAANIEGLKSHDDLSKFLEEVQLESGKLRNAGRSFSADSLFHIWIRENTDLMARYLLEGPSD